MVRTTGVVGEVARLQIFQILSGSLSDINISGIPSLEKMRFNAEMTLVEIVYDNFATSMYLEK